MGAVIRLRERIIERRLRARTLVGGVSRSNHPMGHPGRVVERNQPGRHDFSRLGKPASGDIRARIPKLGLREYWYPALPAGKVRAGRPMHWRMLGEDLALFRNQDGEVAAISDVCPHRGASMSRGKCFYKGMITCPYHGATFDGSGACTAFITEGPDSRMPSILTIRAYPTRTLRGWVWVWMGESAPAPIEEDVPPEFFEDEETVICSTYTYWPSPWILAIENQGDAHNAGPFVHRNSMMQLTSPRMVRLRSPRGPRISVVEDRALRVSMALRQQKSPDRRGAEHEGQLYYPGVDGYWPKTRMRLLVWKLLSPWYRFVTFRPSRTENARYDAPEEWGGGDAVGGFHLPSAIRVNLKMWMLTRYAVPVDEELSRVVYFHTRRYKSWISRTALRVWFRSYLNWWYHYNFSGQDSRAASPCRYWTEETLAPTDSAVVGFRRLVVDRSRDAKLARAESTDDVTSGEVQGADGDAVTSAETGSALADEVSATSEGPPNLSQ